MLNNDVKAVLQAHGKMLRGESGEELRVDCWFCQPPDTKGHLYFNSVTGQYYCHRCGAKGNLVTLGWAGSNTGETAHSKSCIPTTARADILEAATSFYDEGLTPGAREYLYGRSFADDTIQQFRLGYASGGLREHLARHGCDPDQVKASGLVRDDGRDYFYRRLIIPYIESGRVVTLRGRMWPDGPEQVPKYLSLPGDSVRLFNSDAIRRNPKLLLLCEGELDAMIAVQNGIAAVGVPGAMNFKPEWAEFFSQDTPIAVVFDPDRAGEQGTLKVIEAFGPLVRVVRLPEGLDVNDYFKTHSREDFDLFVQQAQDPIRYLLSRIPPTADKTELPRLLEPVVSALAKMDKATTEAYLSHEIKPRFQLKREEIDGYRQLIKRHREAEVASVRPPTAESDGKRIPAARFDGLVDLVEHEGRPAFLLSDGTKLWVQSEVELDGRYCVPPGKANIPWPLVDSEEALRLWQIEQELPISERDAALYDDLRAYHKSISELPSDEYYDLIVAWVLHTYLPERAQYSPIICLFAVPERGKSRTGKGMVHVAFRGVHVESLRDPYIVRMAHDFGATLFFDVKDVWKKAERNGSEDILLHRYERGAMVPRVLYPDRGPYEDIRYYSIFGPTVIATNEPMDRILETRCISINMPTTRRRFETDVTPERGLSLRARLLAFRARHLGVELPDIRKPAEGRLGDILKPLLQILELVRPNRKERFLELVQQLETQRQSDKAETLEAQVLEAMFRLRDKIQRGVLANQAVTEELNRNRPETYRLSPHRVASRLRALGFSKAKTETGASGIVWDEELVDRLMGQYGLRETSGSSGRPGSSGFSIDDPDETDVPDVCCAETGRVST